MGSIMDLAKTEAMLFKYGSGSGVNLSPLRGPNEKLSKGGVASGPVSFMRGLDAFAGADQERRHNPPRGQDGHPQRRPSRRPRLHRLQGQRGEEGLGADRAGLRRRFTGEAYRSVFFQNANHSVRVTDEFMRAVENDAGLDHARASSAARPRTPTRRATCFKRDG